jgi:mono/diheme cytochrome c family protein
MSKVLEWIGKIVGSLLALLVLATALLYGITGARLNKTYDIPVEQLSVTTDAASIERGRHLVATMGLCRECHGVDLAGQILDDDPIVGRLVAPNLTSGRGGVGRTFSDADFVRAIRHGIGQDGKSLIAMSSNYYYGLSDADLAAVIAYLKSLPPVDKELPATRVGGPLGRVYLLIEPSLLVADAIDHNAPRPPAPEPGVTVEYGRYLALTCSVCHADNLAGKPGEGGGLNLTPGGELAGWTQQDFMRTLRTGVTPAGKELNAVDMPWKSIGQMTDAELTAIWLYLQSLPPVETAIVPE